MSQLAGWLSRVVSTFWDSILKLVSTVTQFLIDILVLILNLAVDAFFWVLVIGVSILPPVPELPGSTSFGGAFLGVANYFFPFAEFLQGLTFLATVYAGVGVYKLAKFLRGGG